MRLNRKWQMEDGQSAAPLSMTWHCLECHRNFTGPCNRPPAAGCAYCGSRRVFDCNLEPLDPETERLAIAEFMKGGRQ